MYYALSNQELANETYFGLATGGQIGLKLTAI
jgi:hypothetical protein